MTNRWKTIDRIFEEALELSAKERGSFLEEACGSDHELRKEVEELLNVHEQADTLLDDPAKSRTSSIWRGFSEEMFAEEVPTERTGQRVGAWRLIEEIGRGGMGVVYLAERVDGEFDQKVALKLVKRGLDTDAILERFRNERQVLATLQSPYIARLYDGGVTEEGTPWFAMEYVEGLPITEYCEENDLSLDERLALAIKVCRALAHAHNRLIIHRDLKPSNILVTNSGNPRLLDFGLAKVMQDPRGEPSTTCRGQRWMTLDYASPEMLRGDAVGTPSDTYQLGLILYELLTGKKAYDVDGLPPNEAEHVICEVDPSKPSTTVAPDDSDSMTQGRAVLKRNRLRGDLDTIVMKALSKDPSLGYSSAESMAGDLERHLAGLPILARPATLGYRAKKFVQRNRWPTLAGALLVLTLLGGMAGTLSQANRATSNERRALDQQEKAEEITAFLMALFEAGDPNVIQGDMVSVGAFLEQGARRADMLEQQPDLQATLFGVTAQVARNLGNYQQAEELYRRALSTWKTIPVDPEHKETYVQALDGLARTLVSQQCHQEAESLLREALELQSDAGIENDLRRNVLYTLFEVLHNLNRREAANEVFAAWEETTANAPTAFDVDAASRMMTVAQILGRRGEIRGNIDDVRRGLVLIERALATYREQRGPRHLSVARALLVKVELLTYEHSLQPLPAEGLAHADAMSRNAVILFRESYPELHPNLGSSLLRRSNILMALDRYDEAEETIREALEIAKKLDNDGITMRGRIGLAHLDYLRGNYQGAKLRYRKIRDLWADSYGEDYLLTLRFDLNVGESLTGMRQFEQAEQQLLEAYGTLESQRGRTDHFTQQAIEKVVDLYDAWGKTEEAAQFRERLIEAEQ